MSNDAVDRVYCQQNMGLTPHSHFAIRGGSRGICYMSCGKLFKRWRGALENEPEYWFVRDVPGRRIFANKAAREWLDWHPPVLGRITGLMFAHPDDVHKIEDAHSFALKTGRMARLRARIKIRPNTWANTVAEVDSDLCDKCKRGCRVILVLSRQILTHLAFASIYLV